MNKTIQIILLVFLIEILSYNNLAGYVINCKEKDMVKNQGLVDITLFWEQINEDGFRDKHNIAPRGIEIFNNELVIGLMNLQNIDLLDLPFEGIFSYLLRPSELSKKFISKGCEIWSFNGVKWRQIIGDNGTMLAGFGNKNNIDCSLLVEYKGYLYAGLWNPKEGCQIWRTKNIDEKWDLVIERGFDNLDNQGVIVAKEFNGDLYLGTGNMNGCEIFKTNNGEKWDSIVGGNSDITRGFWNKNNYYAWSMCVYDSQLYVGTSNDWGGELWRSRDGLVWEPVIAYGNIIEAKLHNADFPRGFGKKFAGGFRNLIVFNNNLYLFSAMWGDAKLTINGFNKQIDLLFRLPDFNRPFSRLVSLGGQIWRYNSTRDEWKREVGGWGQENYKAGFGDSKNQYLWSVIANKDFLYVGTLHPDPFNIVFKRNYFFNYSIIIKIFMGQGELWRYNGINWKQINEDGFNDKYNIGIRTLIIYNNCIIAGTTNVKSGCEIWKYDLSVI